MANEQHNAFIAIEFPLTFFYGKPVVNEVFTFYEDDNETEYSFTGQMGYTFKVWEEGENGKLLLSLSQGNGLNLSGNTITMNANGAQMRFRDGRGKYYYEMAYLNSGGYEIVLLFKECKLI